MSMPPKNRKRDALTTSVQDRIVLLIQGWKPEWGDFSASALERKVTRCLGISCTRQGLLKKEAIKAAFDERLKLGTKKAKVKSADVVVLQQRIDRLEEKLAQKVEENERLQELIIRHRHNAKLIGIPAERLEAPIAPLVSGISRSR